MTEGWFLRVLACVVLLTTSIDLVRPMVSYRALELGANTAQIGYIAASFSILSFLIAIPVGQWIDQLGETRFMMIGASIMAAVAFWLASATSLLQLGIGQALLGGGQIAALVAIQTLIANCSPAGQRDGRFGAFAFAASLGQIAGPAIGGLISSSTGGGTRETLLASVGTFSLMLLLAASLHRWPPTENERTNASTRTDAALTAMVRVLRLPSIPQAMIASLTVIATIDILVAYVPVYGEANGIPVATVGLLLSARAAAAALSRLVMVPLIRLLGRRRLFLASLALPAAALVVVPLVNALPLLFVLLALAGFGLGLGQPMSLGWVSRAVPPDSRGIALGVRLTGNRAGQIALPAAIGAFGGAAGVTAIFVALGILLFGSMGAVVTADFATADND